MKIMDIAFKDLIRSFRSLFAVGMMVVAPLLLIGLIYFAFGGASGGATDIPQVSVGVVNADVLPTESPLDESLGVTIRSMFFDDSVASWMTSADYADENAVRAALDTQEIGVAVLIPQDFTAKVIAGEASSQVTILSDPTLTIAPQVAQNMVAAMLDGVTGGGVAIETIIERQQAAGIDPDPNQIPALIERYGGWYADFQRALFHHPDRAALVMEAPAAQGKSESAIQKMLGLMMAGQMVFFSFFTGAYSMMSILREDEEGTLPRLFTTPVDRASILAGKFLAVFLSVVVQGIVLITASRFAFGINWGEPLAVVLTLAGQVIAASGLGVMLISFVKNMRQTGFVLGGVLSVLGMLSGLFTANIDMPEAFNKLANFTPQGWVLKSWKLVLNGQPTTDLALPLVVLVVMGAVMFAVGALRFRKRFA